MRTMLIPTILLLFCSLTQPANGILIEDCGKIYRCFVPSNCILSTDTKNLDAKEITMLTHLTNVNDDCTALFRFHSFSENKAQVSIMSFDTDVESIIFRIINTENSVKQINEFSCDNVGGKYKTHKGIVLDVKKATDKVPQVKNSLQCTFVVELKKKSELIFNFPTSDAQFVALKKGVAKPMVSAEQDHISPGNQYLCDWSSLQFNNEVKDGSKYTEVSIAPDRVFCEDDVFFEPKYNKGNSWEKVNTLECTVANNFVINGVVKLNQALVDIRCEAEAKYFCNYDISSPKQLGEDEKILHRESPKSAPKTPSVLKCDDTHPYLFIDGKYIKNQYNIECRNYGGTEYWTVIENFKKKNGDADIKLHRLTPTGPEAYCAAKIDCDLKYKIPDSSLKKGTMENKVPVCFNKDGTLKADGVQIDDNKVQCDRGKGDYTYSIGNQVHTVTDKTKFACTYPEIIDEEQDRKDKNKLIIAGSVAITLCLGLVIGAIVGAVVWSKKHIKKMNAKREKEAMELFKRVEMGYRDHGCEDAVPEVVEEEVEEEDDEDEDDDEKNNDLSPEGIAAYEKKQADKKAEKERIKAEKKAEKERKAQDEADKKEVESAPCADPSLWNDLVMDFRNITAKKHFPNDPMNPTSTKSVFSNPTTVRKTDFNRRILNAGKEQPYRKPRLIARDAIQIRFYISECKGMKDFKKKKGEE